MRQQEARSASSTSSATTRRVSARYVHKQIDRAIEDIGVHSTQPATRSTSSPTPAKALTALRSDRPVPALPKAVATTTRWSSPSKRRFSDSWDSACQLPAGAASTATTRVSRRSDEPGRTIPNVGRLFDAPFMMFDRRRQPALRPAADGSSAPVQGAVHLPVPASAVGLTSTGTSRAACRSRVSSASTWPATAGQLPRPRHRRPYGHSPQPDRPPDRSRTSACRAAGSGSRFRRYHQPVRPGRDHLDVFRPTGRTSCRSPTSSRSSRVRHQILESLIRRASASILGTCGRTPSRRRSRRSVSAPASGSKRALTVRLSAPRAYVPAGDFFWRALCRELSSLRQSC